MKLESVNSEDLTSVLTLNEQEQSNIKHFFDKLDTVRSLPRDKRESFRSDLEKSARELLLKDFIVQYIKSVGLKPEIPEILLGSHGWISEDDLPTVPLGLKCEGANVIPTVGWRVGYLDGYVPYFEFNFKKDSKNLSASAELKSEGTSSLKTVEDVLMLQYPTNADGIVYPIINAEGEAPYHVLKVASVEQVSAVLRDLQNAYKTIGKDGLERLNTVASGFYVIRRELDGKAPELKEIMKREYKLALLEVAGKQFRMDSE